MNNHIPKAYNELMDRLLSPEDRTKLETVIGSMLSGGPPEHVLFYGPAASGKTTMMRIIKRLLTMSAFGDATARVAFRHSGNRHIESEMIFNSFVFAEATRMPEELPPGDIFLRTTGERLPVNKYYVLMDLIDSELDEIAEHCIRTYQNTMNAGR